MSKKGCRLLNLHPFDLANLAAKLHIPPVLAADLKQCVGNLAEGAVFHRFHQLSEEVAISHGHLLELLEPRRGRSGVARVQPGYDVMRGSGRK